MILKQFNIIEYYYENLKRMKLHGKEKDEDDSEDDDDSCYLDCFSDSEDSMCVEDLHNKF